MTTRSCRYVCSRTGETFSTDTAMWKTPDGAHINLSEGAGLKPEDIDRSERSLWRYSAAIRVPSAARVSLGEGWTPLIEKQWRGRNVHFKAEYFAPSGSFKDRGTAVMASYLRSVGITQILEDSSGNAGASLATYGKAAGLECRILVPASAPRGKIIQMMTCGADVVRIDGDRQAVADAALREAETLFYASHNWQPFFIEGTKTLAFEIWEQFGGSVPDAIVVPIGYGSNVLGCWLGFRELMAAGQIDRMPRLYAVQAENCAPFHATFQSGGDELVEITPKPTAADGIASGKPVRVREVIGALRGSNGATVTVSEDEITASLKDAASAGFFIEPTCATAVAAFEKLTAAGTIAENEKAVVILTGTGLKAIDKIGQLLGID